MNSTKKGKNFENIACEFLIKKGFRVIDRNFYTKFGEIDIIALNSEILHFVEVKGGINFEPIYNINKEKVQKIIKSIYIYLEKRKFDFDFYIDAIIIKNGDIEFIENINI